MKNQEKKYQLAKRSVTIAGHRTSISLENAFWTSLKEIAVAEDSSVADLIRRVDRKRKGNLSSAVRVFVLNWIKQQHESESSD